MTKFTSEYSEEFSNELISSKSKARIAKEDPLTDLTKRVEQMSNSGAGVTRVDLERYIGTNDLMRINYLERGSIAAKAVCRIYVQDQFGANGEWGTGFLITPSLLITNNHVIKNIADATRAFAEFEFEADINGRMKASKTFLLKPDLCFITSLEDQLDFTIVAIAEHSEDGLMPIGKYGFLRMIPTTHKVDEKEYVTIIQHPNGGEKYVAIRENEVLKIGDAVDPAKDKRLWYSSDTARGSSGAPVFNDQWQVVSLHHSSVTESRDQSGAKEIQLVDGTWIKEGDKNQYADEAIKYVANEGIRTSKIIEEIKLQHTQAGAERFPLIQELLDDISGIKIIPGTKPKESIVADPQESGVVISADGIEKAKAKPKVYTRELQYYNGRQGFDENFLGVEVGLPAVTEEALGTIATVANSMDNVLRYTHFSVVHNSTRKIAFFAAVNINGKSWTNLNRGTDKWYYDPRIAQEEQIGDELYGTEPKLFGTKGYFDRGHLVRRLDPVWGDENIASVANDDTFHWANCSPQYWGFNQGQELWQGLENYILYNTDEENVLANVYNGPIFQSDDEVHRGVQIPKYFWKVVVVKDKENNIFSSAYVVDQSKWATNIPFEVLPVGDFNNFQTSIEKLESATKLLFPEIIKQSDVMKGKNDKDLRSLADIEHPRR